MAMDPMVHAPIVRQPRPGAPIKSVDEAAPRPAPQTPIEIPRDGNFPPPTRPPETPPPAGPPLHAGGAGAAPTTPPEKEARWLLQQPSPARMAGAPPAAAAPAAPRREATYTRMHIAHASVAPSCAMALYRDGRLQVWSHTQGVYPLRAALARTLRLDPAAISVHHAQGPGCYGHNGADDAAADAAVLAVRRPG